MSSRRSSSSGSWRDKDDRRHAGPSRSRSAPSDDDEMEEQYKRKDGNYKLFYIIE